MSLFPITGQHDVLDAFVARKHISIASLVRLGGRLSDHTVLAFAFPGGVKYRDMLTGRRWNTAGATFTELKIIPAGAKPTERVLVCEGETDAARLSELYPVDVAVMPAGAMAFQASYVEQLRSYRLVLIALDNDAAGDKGAV